MILTAPKESYGDTMLKPLFKKITSTDEKTLEKMTSWMYEWWGKDEDFSPDAVACYLKHGMQENRLPQTYGIFLGQDIIGMYQFLYDDLTVRPDIYPWLANVYVEEKYRGIGFGKILMENIKRTAQEDIDFDEIYLYTEHFGLYEKFGWEFVSEIDTFLDGKRIQRLYRLKLR